MPPSRRSAVYARHGAVATSQPLAAQAGLDVLKAGGNAADAALATAAMLQVVEPMSTGIGGDLFALYFDARARTVSALNGSGRAPEAATLQRLATDGLTPSGAWPTIPLDHPHSVTVPGTVRAWADLAEKHGSMPLGALLAPAIATAREGFPVSPLIAHAWHVCAPKLLARPEGGAEYLVGGESRGAGTRAPRAGEVMRLPALADTLQAIAEDGAAAFYAGPIAERIAAHHQKLGGLLTPDDLARHVSTWETTLSLRYRDVVVHECPPNGQGLVALIALACLQGFELAALSEADRLHLVIEALRIGFADARRYCADPGFLGAEAEGRAGATPGVPRDAAERLLAPEAIAAPLAALRTALRAGTRLDPGALTFPAPWGAPSADTVYLTVIDGQGNACSLINSLFHGFGSGIVVPGTGICLQNRGACFRLTPGHPNAIAPGKRPYHTIIPALLTRPDGTLLASFGVMGGFMQPQGHVQALVNRFDLGLDPQAALDAPRVCLEQGDPNGRVLVEPGLDAATLPELARRGHELETLTGHARTAFGGGQWLERDAATGVIAGGSDPRKDGSVAAW